MAYHEPPCNGHKLCNKCNEVKHVLAFSVHSTNSDGLLGICRQCHRLREANKRHEQLANTHCKVNVDSRQLSQGHTWQDNKRPVPTFDDYVRLPFDQQ